MQQIQEFLPRCLGLIVSYYIQVKLYVIFCFFFLMGQEFELRASHLQNRSSTTWATLPVHFALFILEMGVWTWKHDPADLNLPCS
jgi:hypothetical protein